jgi:hypothetical protein
MDRAEFTQQMHGWDNTFVPIKLLDNYEEIKTFLVSYGLDPDKFYYTGRMFNEYSYANGTVIIDMALINKQYFDMMDMKKRIEVNEKIHAELLADKDYHGILFLIDKPYRFHRYIKLFKDIPDKDKYQIFIDIYTSSEYGFNEIPQSFIETLIKKYKPADVHNINTDEDELIVYRGESSKSTPYDKSFSWTLDKNVAIKFAMRFNQEGRVYQGFVKTKDILCYLDCKHEKEVLISPGKVYDVDEIIF